MRAKLPFKQFLMIPTWFFCLLILTTLFCGCDSEDKKFTTVYPPPIEWGPRFYVWVTFKQQFTTISFKSEVRMEEEISRSNAKYRFTCYRNRADVLMCILYENGTKVSDFSLKMGESFRYGDFEVVLHPVKEK